jgi:hypothetical protein
VRREIHERDGLSGSAVHGSGWNTRTGGREILERVAEMEFSVGRELREQVRCEDLCNGTQANDGVRIGRMVAAWRGFAERADKDVMIADSDED